MSKEDFKNFVKKKPQLIKYVNEKNISWQKLYEIYELYGDNNEIWNEYIKEKKTYASFDEIIAAIKNIDLERLQSGIENIQNTISLIQNFGSTKTQSTYEPRYNYKHLDD